MGGDCGRCGQLLTGSLDERSFLAPVLLAVGPARARRAPCAAAGARQATAAASMVAMVLVLTWVFYFFTTRAGLPGALTWDTFTADLREAVTRFREDQAPVEPVRGFVAGSAVGFWIVAFLADWSAFRLWAPLESTIPAGSLFVFASLLGADQSRTVTTVLFFLAAVGFLLLHRLARLEMSPSWVRGDSRSGVRAQLAVGGGITAVALVGVALVGPFLPGATAAPLLDVKDIGNDDDTRITVSPLVDIKQRLVDQRETEVFRVTSPVHAYWRLTALDEFDGRTWKSSKRFEKVDGDLPGATSAGDTQVTQQFSISNLAQIWLPAAFEPLSVTAEDREVRWEPTTATLIVDRETSDGLEYSVTSSVTDHSPDELRGAGPVVPSDIADEFLALPRRLPDSVQQLARDITAGAGTPYDRALALQNYFRDNYTYSVEVTGGQDINAIEEFLFSDVRAGYCEQFAGSFAAMARSIGLPRPGGGRLHAGRPDPDPERPDSYIVKGRTPRLARRCTRRVRVGAVRADARPWRRQRHLHRHQRAAGQRRGPQRRHHHDDRPGGRPHRHQPALRGVPRRRGGLRGPARGGSRRRRRQHPGGQHHRRPGGAGHHRAGGGLRARRAHRPCAAPPSTPGPSR
ncbi:MAG: DUF3488 and transglutaminase-like domain-containing protein [Acidimicrobiales bacterium]